MERLDLQKILEEVIKLKKKKKKTFFNSIYISALLVTIVFLMGNVTAMVDPIGEYGYSQIWNMSDGNIYVGGLEVAEMIILDTFNLTGDIYINTSGEGALTIERDGGGEIMSFVREGVEIGQILLNSNDFNIDARTNALVFMIGTTEKMRIGDDGNVNITQNLSVEDLTVRSGSSITLANLKIENKGTHTDFNTDGIFHVDEEPTAFLGVHAHNDSIWTHANFILEAGILGTESVFNIVKNSPLHPFSPNASGIINDGSHGTFVPHTNRISWWGFTSLDKDEDGNIENLTGMNNWGHINQTGLLVNGSATADSFIGDGSLLTGISGGSNLWTNSSGDATYTSGYVGIGTSSPTEKLHLANGTFLQTPGNPTLAGVLFDSTNMYGPKAVHVSGKYAYVISDVLNSLAIVDISDPSSPNLTGVLFDSTNMYMTRALYVSGKYAYVIGYGSDTLAIVDISDASSPTLVGVLKDATNMYDPQAVYVSGKYAYVVGTTSDSLAVIDISDPSSPNLTGVLFDSTNMNAAWSVYVSGKYAYVAGYSSDSLVIVDISDPSSPNLTGVLKDSTNMDGPRSVYVSGKYAYVTGKNSDSLAVIDISDPSSPILTGVLIDSTNMNSAKSVYVSGKYAYVASYSSDSLAIVDISDASSPILVGNLADSTNMDAAWSVYVSGKYAYVVGSNSDSLAIVDIGGIDSPSANIGDLAVSTLDVSDNLDVANDLSVGSGIAVGERGIFSDGPISIGDTLNVNGDVNISGDLFVQGQNMTVPDYVFEDGYNLLTIKELEIYIEENSRLPDGLQSFDSSINNRQYFLLEKIEEQIIYTIQQQSQIEELKAENDLLKDRLDYLEERLNSMELICSI